MKKLIIKALALIAIPAMSQENAEVKTEQDVATEQTTEQPAEQAPEAAAVESVEIVNITKAYIKPDAKKTAWDVFVVAAAKLDEPTIMVSGKPYDLTLVSETSGFTYQASYSFYLNSNNTMIVNAKNLDEDGYNIGVVVSKTSDGNLIELTPGKAASLAPVVAPSATTLSPSSSTAQSSTQFQGQLDRNTIFYGADWIDPNTLAKARADYMAQTGQMVHLGGGIVRTNMGTLAEGIGMSTGNSTPNTCVATNGTAAVGDGISSGAYGTYRSRLYNSPGTTSGGAGGRRRRR